MLIYRGEFPEELPVDENLPALQGSFSYPLAYGYSAVGEVVQVGAQMNSGWLGARVFAFQPHASHFIARPEGLHRLPEGISFEDAVFLPNLETATNFVLDGAPLIGEQVAVFGQGIVGLLTTALLASFPLASLVTLDHYPRRREASLELGATASLDPAHPEATIQARELLQGPRPHPGADLVFELSGSPQALDQAIAVAGYHARIVIGSWYGKKRAPIDLGGRFHRDRLRLVSSQVSSIAPEISARWTKGRRIQSAWESMAEIRPARFITHRFPLADAPEAYRLLDQHPEDAIQMIFAYI